MARTEAQNRATRNYRKKHVKSVSIEFNRNTETDLIEWIEAQDNIRGAIKDLIRTEIEKRPTPKMR